jgi:hypothetical protein
MYCEHLRSLLYCMPVHFYRAVILCVGKSHTNISSYGTRMMGLASRLRRFLPLALSLVLAVLPPALEALYHG